MVFIAWVYANGFLLCCGSVLDCLVIGPDGWLTITANTESWCPCLAQSQWAGVFECFCLTFPTAVFKRVYTSKVEQTCPSRGIPTPPGHCCTLDGPISGLESYSRCIWVKPWERVTGRLTGWQAWSPHWEGLCVCPPHPCPPWSTSVCPDLSVRALACRGRAIKCHDPFFFLCAIWRPSCPLTFTQLSLKMPGLSRQALISNTCTKGTQKRTEDSSSKPGNPIQGKTIIHIRPF